MSEAEEPVETGLASVAGKQADDEGDDALGSPLRTVCDASVRGPEHLFFFSS